MTAKAVMLIVSKELRQGLRARDGRQNEESAILSTSSPGTSSACFLEAPCLFSGGEVTPLGED